MSAYETKGKTCNRVAALLMALLLILQFVPYWHYGEGEALSASINSYVWFPHHHQELTAQFAAQETGYIINPVAYPTVGVFVLCVLGTFLCLWKSSSSLVAVLPVMAGALGLFGYLSAPAFQAGGWYWLHVLLFVLMIVMGVCVIALNRRARKAQ